MDYKGHVINAHQPKSAKIQKTGAKFNKRVALIHVLGAAWCPKGRPRKPKDRPRRPKPDFLQVLDGFFIICG